jgi:hypothetical protein
VRNIKQRKVDKQMPMADTIKIQNEWVIPRSVSCEFNNYWMNLNEFLFLYRTKILHFCVYQFKFTFIFSNKNLNSGYAFYSNRLMFPTNRILKFDYVCVLSKWRTTDFQSFYRWQRCIDSFSSLDIKLMSIK